MDDTIKPASGDQNNDMEFYIVSPKKFLILFIGTVGLYAVYWFYKQWDLYKKSTKEDIWPLVRCIFSIFHTHSLFALFETKYQIKTGTAPQSINTLATLYVVAAVGSQVASKLSEHGYGNPLSFYISLLALPVTGYVFYQAQLLVNASSHDPSGSSNNKLGGLNYLWLVLGLLSWCLMILWCMATPVCSDVAHHIVSDHINAGVVAY